MYAIRSPTPIANLPSAVDVDPVGRGQRQLVSVDRRVAARDTPTMCARGRPLRRRVSGIELCDGGLEVVEVEHDDRRDPVVGVDLDDAEQIDEEPLGRWSRSEKRLRVRTRRSPRVAMAVDVMFEPRSATTAKFSISASRPRRVPCVYDPPAIVDG